MGKLCKPSGKRKLLDCISGMNKKTLRLLPGMADGQCLKKRYMEPQTGIGNAGENIVF